MPGQLDRDHADRLHQAEVLLPGGRAAALVRAAAAGYRRRCEVEPEVLSAPAVPGQQFDRDQADQAHRAEVLQLVVELVAPAAVALR